MNVPYANDLSSRVGVGWVGEGCDLLSCWWLSELPGCLTSYRKVCSLNAPLAASGALRRRVDSAHSSLKVDWSLDALLAGSQPGLGEDPNENWRDGNSYPRKHSLGTSVLNFHLGLICISSLVESDFKSHCFGIT